MGDILMSDELRGEEGRNMWVWVDTTTTGVEGRGGVPAVSSVHRCFMVRSKVSSDGDEDVPLLLLLLLLPVLIYIHGTASL